MIFDTKITLEKLTKDGYSLSWTRKNQYDCCPAQWFISNFCRIGGDLVLNPLMQENTYSIPGWVIQKLFETFINCRIYKMSSMKSLDDIYQWFDRNIIAVCKTITHFTYDEQNNIVNSRSYFQTNEGKALVQQHVLSDGLDPHIKGLQLQFIDQSVFTQVNKSWDKFYARLSKICHNILNMWIQDKLNLDKMLCESFVHTYVGPSQQQQFHIVGRTDFIYNNNMPDGMVFDDLAKLQPGFSLIDGKYNLSKFVHPEQLQLYNTVLYNMYKKVSSYIMFLDYNGCRYKAFQPDLNYKSYLTNCCAKMANSVETCRSFLNQQVLQGNLAFDAQIAPVQFTPNDVGCSFCQVKDCCDAYTNSSVKNSSEIISAKKQKEAVKKELDYLTPDEIHTITL